MARVKKPWDVPVNVDDPAKDVVEQKEYTLPAATSTEDIESLSMEVATPIPVELPVPAPAPPVAPAPVKAAVAKVYQAGDEYSAGGKKGKVIVVLKDILKVRWGDGSIGFVKK